MPKLNWVLITNWLCLFSYLVCMFLWLAIGHQITARQRELDELAWQLQTLRSRPISPADEPTLLPVPHR